MAILLPKLFTLGPSSPISTLNSALCIPLRGREGVAGVLTLYHREKNCFFQRSSALALGGKLQAWAFG